MARSIDFPAILTAKIRLASAARNVSGSDFIIGAVAARLNQLAYKDAGFRKLLQYVEEHPETW